jgi:hypothetical protein
MIVPPLAIIIWLGHKDQNPGNLVFSQAMMEARQQQSSNFKP